MKLIIVILLSILPIGVSASQRFEIFDITLIVHEDCKIEFSGADGKYEYQFPFSDSGKCRVVTHAGTNVAHIKFIKGMYILFVENNMKRKGKCSSEYAAVGISKKNAVYVSEKIKRSGSCYQDKESHAFEYFSTHMKPLVPKTGS